MEYHTDAAQDTTQATAPAAGAPEAQAPTADNRGIVRVASLVGREIARLDEGGQTDLSAFSPTSGCIINQDQLEPILAAHAQKMGSVIRFGSSQ